MITNKYDQVSEKKESTGPATAAAVLTEEVFLGIDTAKTKQVVARYVLGEGVKPAEGMTTATLLARVAKWRKAGAAVHCVYEAGPTGFALARQLIALGATCLVVRPRRLDRHGRRRKTDPLDAQHLAEDLVAHRFGRKGPLCPVRLPSEAEELRRLAVRERETLSRTRHQLLNAAKGRALALGHALPKEWWRPRVLPKVTPALPPALARQLERAAAAAAAMMEQLEAVEAELKADAPPAPIGVGALTVGVMDREVCDWTRFASGKKLASFVGLCPSEDSSAERHRLGSIDKHGSPRLRFWCQETAWRLLKFQRQYRGVIWAREKMRGASKGRAKQIAVALARRFLIDWWRVRTGRATCAELGLVFKTSPTTTA
jgi:transposase